MMSPVKPEAKYVQNGRKNLADDSNTEEGIKVVIRMRRINEKKSKSEPSTRAWQVLNECNSIAQTKLTGKPLPEKEKVSGRNLFTFDRIFGENCTTREVYDEAVDGIVRSAMNGINGTIFAYGQTSSGKTYTMQGELGGSAKTEREGIIQMAAAEIFSIRSNSTDRIFLTKASFVEIYNEEVYDLLVPGKSTTLAVREDQTKGVYVGCNEVVVTDQKSLVSILLLGEKNRSMKPTAMNQRSSRSHAIFRITIESRPNHNTKKDMLRMNGKDVGAVNCGDVVEGAVRVSTLNFVDLAGSESVRTTGATGERQKEGGKINQSLLTLSCVMAGLGANKSYVNFRDSKLTRILQPSLSGNARLVAICCATPLETYFHETKFTLLFASRAKLVKTRPQVNEILDDQVIINKLRRELFELRQKSQLSSQKESEKNEAHLQRLRNNVMKSMHLLLNTPKGNSNRKNNGLHCRSHSIDHLHSIEQPIRDNQHNSSVSDATFEEKVVDFFISRDLNTQLKNEVDLIPKYKLEIETLRYNLKSEKDGRIAIVKELEQLKKENNKFKKMALQFYATSNEKENQIINHPNESVQPNDNVLRLALRKNNADLENEKKHCKTITSLKQQSSELSGQVLGFQQHEIEMEEIVKELRNELAVKDISLSLASKRTNHLTEKYRKKVQILKDKISGFKMKETQNEKCNA